MSELRTKSLVKSDEDWTFLDVSTHDYTHGFHLYPARMHPEIAKRLIAKYVSDTKKVVFDPFMGSGGVLVEALLHGNNSVGIDVNPMAVLLSKVKTTPINATSLHEEYERLITKSKMDYENGKSYNNTPKSINLKFWYKEDVLAKLAILKHHIFNSSTKKDITDFFKVCFSLASRKASNQRNSIYKIYRINKNDLNNFKPDAFEYFAEICQKNIQKMQQFSSEMKENDSRAFPLLGDTRNVLESFDKIDQSILDDGKAHLVVTSPPYGDHQTTVAYGQFSKHPGLWLELPEEQLCEVDKVGLGGRKKKDSREFESPLLESTIKQVKENDSKRANDVYAYFYDLDMCLEQISNSLKQGESHCCFVVANRTVRRVKIPTDEIIVELGKKYSFRHKETIYRTIANKAMSSKNAPENIVNLAGETMTKESIVIWKY